MELAVIFDALFGQFEKYVFERRSLFDEFMDRDPMVCSEITDIFSIEAPYLARPIDRRNDPAKIANERVEFVLSG